jgi:hypothetical protein
MCKRNLNLLVAALLSIMLVLVFSGITYAFCGNITVDHPTTGDGLVSGDASYVELSINPTAPRFATQYRLYVCCCDSSGGPCTPSCTNQEWGNGIISLQTCDPNASRFSYKLGTPNSGCPETYLWVPPLVNSEQTCKLAAVLLDANVNPIVTGGHVIDYCTGGNFTIEPFGAPTGTVTLSPASATVLPGGPSALLQGVINNYLSINGGSVWPPQNFNAPSQFTVSNKVSEPCTDRTVTIAVQDSASPTPSTATASYIINCSPY